MGRKDRFEISQTHLEGIQLRREPRVELDILRKTIEKFYEMAKTFAQIKWDIDKLSESRELCRKEIIEIAKTTEGLRGLISEKENFILGVFPSEKEITWDRELLKKDLGISYGAIVREVMTISISIPSGFVTERGVAISEEVVEATVIHALTNLGISSEDLQKILRKEIYLNVDEEKLNEMIKQDKVKLQPETRKSKEIWIVRVDPLKDWQKIAST